MSNSLWPHGLQHARLPCPSPTPGVCSHLCASSVMLSPSPPAFNISQHWGLFQWVSSSHIEKLQNKVNGSAFNIQLYRSYAFRTCILVRIVILLFSMKICFIWDQLHSWGSDCFWASEVPWLFTKLSEYLPWGARQIW